MVTFSNLGKYGRLGNQMFQIASVIGIARENGHDYIFPEWGYSSFMTKKLPTGIIQATKIDEAGFHYEPIVFGTGEWDIVGYLQSWKYFVNHKDEVLSYFEPVVKPTLTMRKRTCSLHVRRTDYLNLQDNHPVISMDYYKRAMSAMGDCIFVVFSDDVEWCKVNFVGPNFVFPANPTDIHDMFMMSTCDDHIIANSSFSWWGAYLNKKEDKRVIGPTNWFGPAYKNLDTKDLMPSTWQRI